MVLEVLLADMWVFLPVGGIGEKDCGGYFKVAVESVARRSKGLHYPDCAVGAGRIGGIHRATGNSERCFGGSFGVMPPWFRSVAVRLKAALLLGSAL